MAQRKEYVYNEHDQSQVREVLRQRKKRRRKKLMRRLSVIVVFLLIIGYFVSDISKIQSIRIQGNERLTEQEIQDVISIRAHSSFSIFNDAATITKEIKKLPDVKEAQVEKSFFGDVQITISETSIIGYAKDEQTTYTIDEKGNVRGYQDHRVDDFVKRVPKIIAMPIEVLEAFSKEYAKIPSHVRNQLSEVILLPGKADPTRCQFNMDDGKVLYLRIENMAQQLANNNYEQVINAYPECNYFNFLGKYAYGTEEKIVE